MYLRRYYARYHQQLPVLDEQTEPTAIIDASPLLFWTICFTASRNLLPQQRYFPILCKKITGLLSNLMIVRHDSVYTMQALLILTMWPPPVRRQSDDMRWTYSGMTLQMALHAGCHRVGYEHEYHAFTYSESPSDKRKHTQIWRCWCFVNSLYFANRPLFARENFRLHCCRLSCELGLPCLVPFDALVIKPSDEAALPPDFISKLRIALYVSRINDTLDDSSPKDGRHLMAIARLLEKDLKSLVSELRKSSALWNPTVEFVYLGVLLYVYSFCLRWASAIPLSDPDHAIIQTSAAQSACRLIELYASSLLGPANGTSPTLTSCPQRYYAKSYIQFNTIALIILLKISALNKVSLHQLGEINDAIRTGHSALMACSSSHGDESYRAAAVVEVLCKRGIIKPVGGDSPVQSRFGASLWLELLATAIRWRRQNSQERIRPRDSTSARNDNDCNNSSEGIAIPLTISRVSGPGNAAVATPIAVDQVAGPASTLANLQDNISGFPFSVEDWSTYLDIIQADTELGYDLGV